MSSATGKTEFLATVSERLAPRLSLWRMRRLVGFYLAGAFVAAALFLFIAAVIAYPEKTWVIATVGFAVVTFVAIYSGLKITFSSSKNRFEIRVRATRQHL